MPVSCPHKGFSLAASPETMRGFITLCVIALLITVGQSFDNDMIKSDEDFSEGPHGESPGTPSTREIHEGAAVESPGTASKRDTPKGERSITKPNLGEKASLRYDSIGGYDYFTCGNAPTSFRRREGTNEIKCKVVVDTASASQNTDKNHDSNFKARTQGFTKDLTQCDENCNSCAAGINMGLDYHKCCPGVSFDEIIKDTQINQCHAVNQATVDLSQCGSMSAKCKKFVVWNFVSEKMTSVFSDGSVSLANYETTYGTSGSRRRRNTEPFYGVDANDWVPWRFTMWKHSVCKFENVGRKEQSCSSAKSCTCATSPWQLPAASCSNIPAEVLKSAAVFCGQF